MGLFDYLKNVLQSPTVEENNNSPYQPVKIVEVGTSGTEVFAGQIFEEYLKELRGEQWQQIIDKMYRSDAVVKMCVNALTLPLKSSNVYINTTEQSELAEMQKKVIEKALFEDMENSFTAFLSEAFSMIRCGYSLFDVTHQVKTDSEIGEYNTLKSLSFRSQKTIENWNMNKNGRLLSVSQRVDGDLGGSFTLDARFLLHFAPEKEGNNYEGISVLRNMYGAWLRKDRFQKLKAVGAEKFSIPTAVMTVPPGSESKPEFKLAENALKCYTSGQSNYFIKPQGWELEFNNVTWDGEKLQVLIDAENHEMVNSIIASFLLLGQNGSGSLALGGSLQDFFKQSITYLADHFTEVMMQKIIKNLIKMNFGDVPVLVELKFEGLDEKADAAWSGMIKTLIDAGLIKPSVQMQKYVAQKLKLPISNDEIEEINEVEETENEKLESEPEPVKKELAEVKKKESKESNLIRQTAKLISQAGSLYLNDYLKTACSRLQKEYKFLSKNSKIKAAMNTNFPSYSNYTRLVKVIDEIAYIETKDLVEKKFKGSRTLSEVRLSAKNLKRVDQIIFDIKKIFTGIDKAKTDDDFKTIIDKLDQSIKKAESILEDYLTTAERIKIKARSEIFTIAQIGDLEKRFNLEFQNKIDLVNDDEIGDSVYLSSKEILDGPIILSGSDIHASKTVNDGIQDASEQYAKETGNEILSYTFIAVDDETTTDICFEMNDSTLDANDPDLKKYTPPLHWNCRSFLAVNTSNMKDIPEVTGAPKLSKKAQEQLQFK